MSEWTHLRLPEEARLTGSREYETRCGDLHLELNAEAVSVRLCAIPEGWRPVAILLGCENMDWQGVQIYSRIIDPLVERYGMDELQIVCPEKRPDLLVVCVREKAPEPEVRQDARGPGPRGEGCIHWRPPAHAGETCCDLGMACYPVPPCLPCPRREEAPDA